MSTAWQVPQLTSDRVLQQLLRVPTFSLISLILVAKIVKCRLRTKHDNNRHTDFLTLMDTSHSRGREVGHHTSRPRETHLHALDAAKSGSHCFPDGYSTGERRHMLIRHSGRGALEIWCFVKLGKKRAQ